MGLVGLWLAGSATRAAEAALRAHVRETVNQAAVGVGNRWTSYRSALLDVAESASIRRALADAPRLAEGTPGEGDPARLPVDQAVLAAPLTSGRAHALGGRPVLRLDEAASPARGSGPARDPVTIGPSIPLEVPVHVSPLGAAVGSLTAEVPVHALIPDRTPAPGGVATILAAFDGETGGSLIPLPFATDEAPEGIFTWGGDRWLVVRRELTEPRLTLVGAAPLAPFAEPIRAATRRGTWMLLAVVLAGFAATALVTSRLGRSLYDLAEAVEGVAGGDLERRIDEDEADEVSRVARAFNRMTASLRNTLAELAEHRALAAVGEFAASLAHEIRNPLTAIAVDLEVVEDELPRDSSGHRPLKRALREIRRLDRTVAGTLQAVRSGGSGSGAIGLEVPLKRAVDLVRAEPESRGIIIRLEDPAPAGLSVPGDPDLLEQLFLNLILNAVQAARAGTEVRVVARREAGRAVVEVRDRGPGLSPEMLGRAFEPLVSGRDGGTGLGLTVCRRIVEALGGSVRLENRPEGGAVARVELPIREP